ncbi:RCC1 domain-containing protein [Flavobacterium psychrotolerans]|uniref:Uncharacterized protein n=1 Tax=Flavobacterium psychrotolerans TaxID=2169410 RepID=A0A2U1JGF3_9FLAO|nr:T9SS type A sorting domain-containing protein [Flavobacterium psychrotolerans]PWA04230.1 hypothetical protein DB895_12095 [Flavobacterium psychrotolerans]
MKKLIFLLFVMAHAATYSQTTVLLKDIDPGMGNGSPSGLTNVNGVLFFVVYQSTGGSSIDMTLWKSNGTVSGTVAVKTISSSTGQGAGDFTNVNGILYFSFAEALWKSDGTAIGTTIVKSSPVIFNLENLNGILVFDCQDPATGIELWKTDGTVAGTSLIKDIYPSNQITPVPPSVSTNINGTLFFAVDDGINGKSLWKSDGFTAGTVLVKNVSPMEYNLGKIFLEVNGTIYFTATESVNGLELWKTNGTTAGTTLVKNITAGASDSQLADFTSYNNRLYFTFVNSSNNKEFWKSDGTATGTQLVKQIPNSTPEMNIYDNPAMIAVNGTLFFYTQNNVSLLYELWKSDGTTLGTNFVSSFAYPIRDLQNFNNVLTFTSSELWKSDGTAAGTVQISNIHPGQNAFATDSTPVNTNLFFSATNWFYGMELWIYGSACAPEQPGEITGNTTVNQGATETYTVALVPGATSYTWTLPGDWSGNSTTNSITVVVGNEGGGSISVSTANDCGVGGYSWISVSVGAPLQTQTTKRIIGAAAHGLFICGTGSVMAWGQNVYGQLGNGTNGAATDSTIPVSVNTIDGVTAVYGGWGWNTALKNDGSLWSWGSNYSGTLGNGTNTDTNSPQIIIPSGVIAGAASPSASSSLALKNDGTVWAWGTNTNGQLGNGTSVSTNTPGQVNTLTGITAIAVGGEHCFAIKNNGTVWGWGDNLFGQLGKGDNIYTLTPLQINSLTNVTAIALSSDSSIVLKSDGTVWSFGSNYNGELGNGNFTSSNIPIQITSLSGITSISAGNNFFLALKGNGTVWSWGRNNSGQLGIGSKINSNIPVQVSSLTNIVQISGGGEYSLALKDDDTVWSWGSNGAGQLGNGNYSQRTTPGLVNGLCFGLGINENEIANTISIYPNPSNDFIVIENKNDELNSAYVILNSIGQRLLSGKLIGETTKVYLNSLSSGIYFIKIGETGNQSFKLIKN